MPPSEPVVTANGIPKGCSYSARRPSRTALRCAARFPNGRGSALGSLARARGTRALVRNHELPLVVVQFVVESLERTANG